MAIKTKTITLDGGDWWEVSEEMPYGVRVDIRDFINSHSDWSPNRQVDPVNTIMLLGCAVGWSDEKPINEDNLRKQWPIGKVTQMIRELNILYYNIDPNADEEERKEQERLTNEAEADIKKD